MKKLTLLIIYLLSTLVSFAQNEHLTGRVIDETGNSLPGARVILLRDEQIFKNAVTDTSGRFNFIGVPTGKYTLTVTSVGFDAYQVVVDQLRQLPDIRLKAVVNTLKEVALTYTRPPVEQRAGKTIVNVAGSINATGTSAFEILQKSPGVNVDEAGAVRLGGKTGVQIMIDGKLQPLTREDLAILLKSIPANMIDKIELNTNPSSRYDAGGNAGIIDIRTKQEQRIGTYGNISGSLTQARYGKGTTGMSLNFRKNKWNFSTSYNYTYRKDFAGLDMQRKFFTNELQSAAINQSNIFRIPVHIHNAQAAVDYTLSKTTNIGLSGSFYTNDNIRLLDNRTVLYNAANVLSGYNLTNAESDYHRRNPATTFSVKQKLGATGFLSADLDYAFYSTQNNQTNRTLYFRRDSTIAKNPYTLIGDLTGEVTIRTAKTDFTQPLKGWLSKIETGWKSSWVKSDNDVAFFDGSTGTNEPLAAISNHFIYYENINAAYLSLHRTSGKLSGIFGLRMENTNTTGIQLIGNETKKRSYTQLFPNLSLDYKLDKTNSIGLSISRRIDRPNYRQLNPFRYYLNENTYTVGNVDLKPQLTNAFEISHVLSEKYTFRYAFSRTTNNMTQILSPDPNLPNVVQQTDRNLAVFSYYSVNFSAPVTIYQWLKSHVNLLGNYKHFKGNLANTELNNRMASVQLNLTNTITISPLLTAELTSSYTTRERHGFVIFRSNGMLGMGINQQLLQKKASIKLNVSDIFLSAKPIGNTNTNGYSEDFWQNNDTRQATLSFSYRFGKGGQPAKKKTSGADDERRRAG